MVRILASTAGETSEAGAGVRSLVDIAEETLGCWLARKPITPRNDMDPSNNLDILTVETSLSHTVTALETRCLAMRFQLRKLWAKIAQQVHSVTLCILPSYEHKMLPPGLQVSLILGRSNITVRISRISNFLPKHL